MKNKSEYYKKVWKKRNLDKLALYIGILLFSLSNLGFFKMILNMCGLSEYSTFISVFLYCVLDVILFINYVFTVNSDNKRTLYVLLIINVLYCIPNFVNFNIYLIMQYIVFVLPFTLVIGFIFNENAISLFFKCIKNLSKYIFFLAFIYVVILFTGSFTYDGYVRLDVFSYGDIAYALLPFLVSDLVYFVDNKTKTDLLRSIFYFAVIIYSGTRSAIVCCVLAFIIVFLIFIRKSHKNKMQVFRVTVKLMMLGLVLFACISTFLPDSSRLNVIKNNFLYELGNKNDLYVYDVLNEEVNDINSVFEFNIVKNDCTKDETEKMLLDDIKNSSKKYLIVEDEKKTKAESFIYKYNRPNLWNSAIKEFQKKPFLGNGVFYYQNKYVGTFPHNLLLEVMADFGVVGLFFIILFVYKIIHNLYNSLKINSSDWKLYVLILSYFPQYFLYTTLYNNGIFIFSILAVLLYSNLMYKKRGALHYE